MVVQVFMKTTKVENVEGFGKPFMQELIADPFSDDTTVLTLYKAPSKNYFTTRLTPEAAISPITTLTPLPASHSLHNSQNRLQ
jgi:hypothetical protein